jgi:hypothetical protein
MPAINVLCLCISLRRSNGEESREENRIEGSGAVSAGAAGISGAESLIVVGGLEAIF